MEAIKRIEITNLKNQNPYHTTVVKQLKAERIEEERKKLLLEEFKASGLPPAGKRGKVQSVQKQLSRLDRKRLKQQ